ncbi:hypothetical protein BDZ97DRAFT_1675740, partial [Flammula alnicola]
MYPLSADLVPRYANKRRSQFDFWSSRPSYARSFMWSEDDGARVTLAKASETFLPLPSVPKHELDGERATATITDNPHLFKIISPVVVTRFADYLMAHPNTPFVASVCEGLVNGFWPWADTASVPLPVTLDARSYIRDAAHCEFVKEQIKKEIDYGCFSETFTKLLPGMLAVPVTVAHKARSTKLRMCVNHSSEPFSRNSMIKKSDVSVPLDNLQDLGHILR